MPIHTRPSSTWTSMRSPGPYGGRPETNSRLRSSRSSRSPTPKSRESSPTWAPGWRTTYGTTTNSRRSRSDALDGWRAVVGLAMRCQRLQPGDHVVSDRLRRIHAGVRAEGQDPRGERVTLAGGHVHLDPAVVPRLQHLGAGHVPDCPPRH